MQTEYFTLPELAERWKISIPTIRRKLSSGELNPVYIGRVVRIEASEVERIESAWAAQLADKRAKWNQKIAARNAGNLI